MMRNMNILKKHNLPVHIYRFDTTYIAPPCRVTQVGGVVIIHNNNFSVFKVNNDEQLTILINLLYTLESPYPMQEQIEWSLSYSTISINNVKFHSVTEKLIDQIVKYREVKVFWYKDVMPYTFRYYIIPQEHKVDSFFYERYAFFWCNVYGDVCWWMQLNNRIFNRWWEFRLSEKMFILKGRDAQLPFYGLLRFYNNRRGNLYPGFYTILVSDEASAKEFILVNGTLMTHYDGYSTLETFTFEQSVFSLDLCYLLFYKNNNDCHFPFSGVKINNVEYYSITLDLIRSLFTKKKLTLLWKKNCDPHHCRFYVWLNETKEKDEICTFFATVSYYTNKLLFKAENLVYPHLKSFIVKFPLSDKDKWYSPLCYIIVSRVYKKIRTKKISIKK